MSNTKVFRALAGAAAATLITAASASALTIDGTYSVPSGANDYPGVAGLNFMQGLTLSDFAGQSVEVFGVFAESAFDTNFSADGVGTIIFDTANVISGGTWVIGFTGWLFDGNGTAKSAGLVGEPSDNPAGMGIYTSEDTTGGSVSFSVGDTFYLAYDDLYTDPGSGDDNHDDLILKMRVLGRDDYTGQVPLPAGVWLLGTAIAGFGVARRRRKQS